MKTLLTFCMAFLLVSNAFAQTGKPQAIQYDDIIMHNARTVTHDGTFAMADRSNTVGFDVSITGTSTVIFRVSGPGKIGWQPLLCTPSDSTVGATSTSTSGFYTCNIAGADTVSARVNACTSCTVTVISRVSTAQIGGGGGGGGITSETQGLPDVIAINRTYGGAVSAATGPRFGSSSTGRYWIPYDDPTDGLQWICEVAGVANDCNYIRKLAAGKIYELKNSAGVSKFTWTESTGALTNITLDTEATGNTITIQEESWFDLVACQDSTASHIWDTITGTSPAAACDTGSNTQKGYASFDATIDEAIHMNWVLPAGWTGAIDVHFIWKAAATSGATGWCAQLIRVADASTSDPAFPAQASGNCVSDTAKGTTLQENHATITGVTCTSCAARDHVYVRISRDANGGAVTDDMTGDAHLMKVGRTWRVAK